VTYDPDVTWQPSFDAWDDEYPTNRKLSKKARKRAKKMAKRLAQHLAARPAWTPTPRTGRDRDRQVRLEDADDTRLRVIFCDFDGVLNQHSSGAYSLMREQVERLDRLARECNAVLVVSSWWRWIGVESLRRDLASAGFHGRMIGRTPWLGDDYWDARERGIEVSAVLAYLGDRVESFVILDDHDRMGNLLPNLVQTVASEGLTENDVARAKAILLHRPVTMVRQVSTNRLTPELAPSYTTGIARDGVPIQRLSAAQERTAS
jgi:HAD domain in Swiss Army Knife RNA repair proteins